jgi:dimethylaniline monooxygenase (N-oxide forming)
MRIPPRTAADHGSVGGYTARVMPIDHPHFNPALPRVCVIGAGSTGIAVVKALKDAHVPFVCYERGDRVGGNWVFKNKNGLSSAYRSLHINTSRERMQYRAFPMPADYPDFAHHTLIARYFDEYVRHFELAQFIHFETTVERVTPRADGTYAVELHDGTRELFDLVCVCNGHHSRPRWPTPRFPGTFDGIEMHSHFYVDPGDPHPFVGKRVVIVGMGNSAMDIASELGHPGVAAEVFVAARRGAWILPKYMFGRPIDQPAPWMPSFLPTSARLKIAKAAVKLAVGDMENYGLPRPDHDPGHAHPTISNEFLGRVGSGDVHMKPNIKALEGKRVRFVDDSVVEADVVIYCTGYEVTFPFFDTSFVWAKDNDLPLFLRAFRPGIPSLFFAGLCQPLGAIMPIAEAQGAWLADYACGAYVLPTESEMQRAIERERDENAARYVASPRHTMQVDYEAYMSALRVERRAGAVRARSPKKLPVLARARFG